MSGIKNLATILFITLLLSIFAFSKLHKEESFKVLRIVEGDKLYIDLNNNNLEDKDELLHLNFVNSFPSRYSRKTSEYARKFGLTIPEIISLGYGSREFTQRQLEGRFVTIDNLDEYNPEYNYRFAKVMLNGYDYAKTLLENGFGFSYNPMNYDYYKQFENITRIKENLKALMSLEIMLVDEENKIYHELNCPETLKVKIFKLLPAKTISKNFKKCKYCNLGFNIENEFIKIESPEPNLHLGAIELFLTNPNNYEFPINRCRTNVCQALLKNINNAQTSIDFAIYGFEAQDEIFDALRRARTRGVDIKGVVDIDTKGKYAYYDSEKFLKEFSLVTDKKAALMHNKFFVFDNRKVFTGTTNISKSGTGGYNSNTVVIIDNPVLASYYTQELGQMLGGKFQKSKVKIPTEAINLSDGTKISVCFSPKDDIYTNAFKPLIDSAKSEIFVSAFYLTHKDVIKDLLLAHARGVKIKVIIDATSAANPASKYEILRNAGIPVKVENWGGKNHEKCMVFDSKILLLGSANFSQSSVNKNDENILVIENATVSRAYREHFIKLYNSIDNKYLKTNPSAESFDSGNSCYDGIDNDFDGKIDSKDEGCRRKVLL